MQNKKRKTYHNRYCEDKWGDSRNYDVCVNSAKLGIERTADILEEYIKEFAQ
jgi:cytidylate kinase